MAKNNFIPLVGGGTQMPASAEAVADDIMRLDGAVSDLAEDVGTIENWDAGDIPYDSSENYNDGTVGGSLNDLKSAINVPSIELSELSVPVPFHVKKGDTIVIRSKDGTVMTPGYLQMYGITGPSTGFTTQFNLSGQVSGRIERTYDQDEECLSCALINGTAQNIIVENISRLIGNEFYEYTEEHKYLDNSHVIFNKLNVKQPFFFENGDVLYVKSMNGQTITVAQLVYFYDDGTHGTYGLTGYGAIRKINVSGLSETKKVVAAAISSGTVMDIGVYNMSKLQLDIDHARMNEMDSDIGVIKSLEHSAIKRILTFTGVQEYKEYFPITSGHQYAIWLEGGNNDVTMQTSDDGITTKQSFGTIPHTTSPDVSAIVVTANADAKMIKGASASSTTVTLHIVDISESMEIRSQIVLPKVLDRPIPFIVKPGEIIDISSASGNIFTSEKLYIYDKDMKSLQNYTLKGWNVSNRKVFNTSYDIAYLSQRGGTADDLIVRKIRTEKPYSDEIYAMLADTLPPMTSFNSSDILYRIDPSEKATEFAGLIGSNTDTESFLFFTDPHTYQHDYQSGYDSQSSEYLQTLIQKYYNSTPTNFVLCGGDWLQDSDMPNEAKYKLGLIEASMEAMVSPYYPMVGNHDTNYQGKDSQGNVNQGELSVGEVANLWFSRFGKTYYEFEGANTRFFIFDSWLPSAEMDGNKWDQIDWFASALETNEHPHIAVGIHIWWNGTAASHSRVLFATHIAEIIDSYNAGSPITKNGKTYTFSNPQGHIEFVIVGHMHMDETEALPSGVPIIATTNAGTSNDYSFDLVFADYTARTIKLVRVGTGSNRGFSLDTGLPLS